MSLQIQAMVAHSTGEWPSAVESGLDNSLLTPDLADTLFDGHLCVAEFALTSGDPLDGIRAVAEELHGNATRSGARRAQIFAATLLGEIALITGAIDEAEATASARRFGSAVTSAPCRPRHLQASVSVKLRALAASVPRETGFSPTRS